MAQDLLTKRYGYSSRLIKRGGTIVVLVQGDATFLLFADPEQWPAVYSLRSEGQDLSQQVRAIDTVKVLLICHTVLTDLTNIYSANDNRPMFKEEQYPQVFEKKS